MKQVHNVVQGSPEWHALRRAADGTASEAAVMLGLSKYKKRSQLLEEKATGNTPLPTEQQQRLFDKGHAAEEAARPIAENELGEELYPATYTHEIDGLALLASMDGIDMMELVGWEHKLFNAALAESVNQNIVPDTHWPQLEHQMLVSECESITFSVSDGTQENYTSTLYTSVPERRQQVIDGWKRFKADLASYQPKEAAPVVEAAPVRELPAIRYEMNGLAIHSNLDEFKTAANALVEKANQVIDSDQDFADAEARQKVFTKAEKDIAALCDRVLGEVADIDTFTKDLKYIGEQIRQARLAEGKQIKTRKEEIKNTILSDAQGNADTYRRAISAEIHAPLPAPTVSISDTMKGKRTIDSLQDAADLAVSQIKIEADQQKAVALQNAEAVNAAGEDYRFLFADWKDIAFKAPDDFAALAKSRIADHQEREAQRLADEREKIRKEEAAKAEREAQRVANEQAKRDAQEVKPAKQAVTRSTDTYLVPPASRSTKAVTPVKTIEPKEVTIKVRHTHFDQLTALFSEDELAELLSDDNGNHYTLALTIRRDELTSKQDAA